MTVTSKFMARDLRTGCIRVYQRCYDSPEVYTRAYRYPHEVLMELAGGCGHVVTGLIATYESMVNTRGLKLLGLGGYILTPENIADTEWSSLDGMTYEELLALAVEDSILYGVDQNKTFSALRKHHYLQFSLSGVERSPHQVRSSAGD